jgi:hypothetical protein
VVICEINLKILANIIYKNQSALSYLEKKNFKGDLEFLGQNIQKQIDVFALNSTSINRNNIETDFLNESFASDSENEVTYLKISQQNLTMIKDLL